MWRILDSLLYICKDDSSSVIKINASTEEGIRDFGHVQCLQAQIYKQEYFFFKIFRLDKLSMHELIFSSPTPNILISMISHGRCTTPSFIVLEHPQYS